MESSNTLDAIIFTHLVIQQVMIKHATCQAHLEWLGVTREQTGPHSLPSGVYMLVGLLR